MKTIITMVLLVMGMVPMMAQEEEETRYYPLIGEEAPKFTAQSTVGEITFPDYFKDSWKILFSHPADFTPVCTSEILELCKTKHDFDKLNVKFAVLSTDLVERHHNWIESMEKMHYKDIKEAKVDFPLIADPSLKVSKMYGMIHPNSGSTKDVRAVFIIDPENKIRSILYYPMEVGRNIVEVERTVAALQKHDKDQVLTPANWKDGDDVIVTNIKKEKDPVTNEMVPVDKRIYEVSWFMHMREDDGKGIASGM